MFYIDEYGYFTEAQLEFMLERLRVREQKMTSPTGPQPGSDSASGYDDLSDNTNPYHTGEALKTSSDAGTSQYPTLSGIAGNPNNPSVPGYYFNPPADPNNPFHHELPTWRAGEQALGAEYNTGIDAAANQALEFNRGGDGPQPDKADFYEDEGMGRSGVGRSV